MICCILCLRDEHDPDSLYNLETVMPIGCKLKLSLCEIIYFVTNIRLKFIKDNAMCNICINCGTNAINAYNFKQQCMNAEQYYVERLNMTNNDVSLMLEQDIKIESENIDTSEPSVSYAENFNSYNYEDILVKDEQSIINQDLPMVIEEELFNLEGKNKDVDVTPLQFVMSEKGKRKLLLDGHLFIKEREKEGRLYWKCEMYVKYRCKVRVKTIGDKAYTSQGPHNHAANAARVEASLVSDLIRDRAINSREPAQNIITNACTRLSPAAAAHIAQTDSIKRKIRNIRTRIHGQTGYSV